MHERTEERAGLDERAPPAGRPGPYRALKELVHLYLEKSPTTPGPRLVQLGIMAVILLSVGTMVVETMQVEEAGKTVPLGERYPLLFDRLEWLCVGIFTVEYLLRLWSITVVPRFARPVVGRIRFVLTPMALVDLLAILPSYFRATSFVVARALRLVRIFRIFKLSRYSTAVKTLNRVLVTKRAELAVTLFVIVILLLIASTVMYYVEYDGTPDNKFTSIPATMWWAIVTLTTVGYGDINPITPL